MIEFRETLRRQRTAAQGDTVRRVHRTVVHEACALIAKGTNLANSSSYNILYIVPAWLDLATVPVLEERVRCIRRNLTLTYP